MLLLLFYFSKKDLNEKNWLEKLSKNSFKKLLSSVKSSTTILFVQNRHSRSIYSLNNIIYTFLSMTLSPLLHKNSRRKHWFYLFKLKVIMDKMPTPFVWATLQRRNEKISICSTIYLIHNTEPIKTVNKKIKTNKGKLGVTFYRICLATNWNISFSIRWSSFHSVDFYAG